MAFEYLKNYISNHFPKLVDIFSEAHYEQLDWFQENPYKTNELATVDKPAGINIEIRRSLVRLNCLRLLRSGTEQDYAEFIRKQSEPQLTWEHFKELSAPFQEFDELTYQAIILAAITAKSNIATALAEKAFNEKSLPSPHSDSVIFLAQVMTTTPEIYPTAKELLNRYGESVKTVFNTLFSTGHFRHMLYTEGGTGMFNTIKEKTREGVFKQNNLNLWVYGYWIVNISGFRGHIEPLGSSYLNDDTYKGIHALIQHLSKLLENPDYAVLHNYLLERASWLSTQTSQSFWEQADKPSSYIIGHLAAMLRIYRVEKGQELIKGLQVLKEKLGETAYNDLLHECNPTEKEDIVTPTFAPAVFANIYSKIQDYAKTIELGLPIYAKALKNYRHMLKLKLINADIPLNLNGISEPEAIALILANSSIDISIDPEKGSTKLREISHQTKLTKDSNYSFT